MGTFKRLVFKVDLVMFPEKFDLEKIRKTFEDHLIEELDPVTLNVDLKQEEYQRVLDPPEDTE